MCFSNSEIDVPVLCADVDIPIYWWDSEADRCLLVGVFKHGKQLLSFKGILLKRYQCSERSLIRSIKICTNASKFRWLSKLNSFLNVFICLRFGAAYLSNGNQFFCVLKIDLIWDHPILKFYVLMQLILQVMRSITRCVKTKSCAF